MFDQQTYAILMLVAFFALLMIGASYSMIAKKMVVAEGEAKPCCKNYALTILQGMSTGIITGHCV